MDQFLNQIFVEDLPKISQGFGKIILNMFVKYLAKFYLKINDLLPVLPGNEQDLCHENIDLDLVNTYLFYQVCKVHNIVCLETSLPMLEGMIY